MDLFLASRSPRRQELLRQIGVEFELLDIEVDETWNQNESAEDYVCRVTLEKANAGKQLLLDKNQTNTRVLAADTTVVLDDKVLGKAETDEDAYRMLQQLSGRTHQVLSAVALHEEKARLLLSINTVGFRPLSEKDINDYIKSKEPIGKAGAYAIQGFAATFICHIHGNYSSIMGLPLYETAQLLDI